MQGQNGQQQEGFDLSGKMNMLVALTQIMSKVLAVFLRRPGTWGEWFCSWQMALSWVILFFFGPMFFRTSDPRPMVWVWLAATGGLLCHRVAGGIKRWRGYEQHSQYSGRSWLSWLSRNESTVKGEWEPILVVLAGIGIVAFSQPLGVYLIVSGMCLGIATSWQISWDKSRLRQARDARFDAEWMMRNG